MSAGIRSQLTFANVTSALALTVALGGTSWAAVTITGRQVKDASLTGRDIKSESLTGKQIKNLTAEDFAEGERDLAAVPGPAGPRGADGAPGPEGQAGAPGTRGPMGEPGASGQDGADGQDGAVGPTGPTGATGQPGVDGKTGPTGPAGSPDTGSQILSKLVVVDGSGSLLDADLFDGRNSSAFQLRGTITSCGHEMLGQKAIGIHPNGDLSCAKDFFGAGHTGVKNGVTHMQARWPTYTTVATTTLPAGNYLAFARANLYANYTVVGSTYYYGQGLCQLLIGDVVADTATIAPSWPSSIPLNMVGLGGSGTDPVVLKLQCTSNGEDGTYISASNAALKAIQIDAVNMATIQ